jgi:hypothetical protein
MSYFSDRDKYISENLSKIYSSELEPQRTQYFFFFKGKKKAYEGKGCGWDIVKDFEQCEKSLNEEFKNTYQA